MLLPMFCQGPIKSSFTLLRLGGLLLNLWFLSCSNMIHSAPNSQEGLTAQKQAVLNNTILLRLQTQVGMICLDMTKYLWLYDSLA